MVLQSITTAIRALLADRTSRLIAAGGACLLVCLGLLGAYLCIDLRDTAWYNARRNGENLLAIIEEGVGHSIRSYDLTLRGAAHLATRPDVVALEPGLRKLALFDAIASGSGLGPIAVTDAAGRVQVTSDADLQHGPDLGDLPEFQALRADPSDGLVLVGSARARGTGERIIRMTRRIETPDGSFAGVVTGSILLGHFQSLFDRLRFGSGLTLNVFQRDGTLLIRAPVSTADLGRSIAPGAGYRQYRSQARGEFIGRSFLDGEMRLYAFSNLDDLPLIVTVATSLESIRAAWISKAAIIVVLIVCLDAMTCGAVILLHREVGRHAAAAASSRQANVALALLARTDGLTGLPNRRSYDEVFAAEWDRSVERGTSLSLLIVDADHFKQFNDRYGHHRGDGVLTAMADCLRRTLEAGSIGFRFGGEEFVVLLPGVDVAAAGAAAERIRRAIVNLQIAHAPEIGGVATVSIGVAGADPRSGQPSGSLFAAADAALYVAKKAGRNRVRTGPSETAPAHLARSA